MECFEFSELWPGSRFAADGANRYRARLCQVVRPMQLASLLHKIASACHLTVLPAMGRAKAGINPRTPKYGTVDILVADGWVYEQSDLMERHA